MKVILTSDTHYGFNGKTQKIHMNFLKKIQSENPDLVVHAGDWASNSQNQFYRTLEMFRNHLSCPIFCVRGNHDFWQKSTKYSRSSTVEEMLKTHTEWFTEFNIHHVDNGSLSLNGWHFCGFDGWYNSFDPNTNDSSWLPKFTNNIPTMEFFTHKAHKDLNNLLSSLPSTKEKRVCVTHFPSFTENQIYAQYCANLNYLTYLSEEFSILMVGHSHIKNDFYFKDMRILNCGSDYNNPKYIVIDL